MSNTYKGMDISKWQGSVDMAAAMEDGIQFAILRADFGMIPDKLREKILQEKDLDILCSYLKKAAASKSIEEFETLIKN